MDLCASARRKPCWYEEGRLGARESDRQAVREQNWGREGQGRMRPIRARLCARSGCKAHKKRPLSQHIPVPLIGAFVVARCANFFAFKDLLARAPLTRAPAIAHQDLSLTCSRSLPRPTSLSVHSLGGGGGSPGVTASVRPACAHCVSASGLCFPQGRGAVLEN
jgi:hypothetical protein